MGLEMKKYSSPNKLVLKKRRARNGPKMSKLSDGFALRQCSAERRY